MTDYIDRQAAIAYAISGRVRTLPTSDDGENWIRTEEVRQSLLTMPSAQPEQRWIPVSERLPEEDTEVLISYRYKEGEGDTSHVDIDITTYGQMYFGGNKVGNNKHWRAPFEYFYSNYEVIAWMPLPVPYKGEGEAYETD